MRPVEFRVMGLEPIGAEDDVVSANGCDVEFGAFLVIVGRIGGLYSDGLDRGRSDWSILVGGTVDIFYSKGGTESSECKRVFQGEVMVNDHSFGSAVYKGCCTDFFGGSMTDKGDFERDRRRTYIAYCSFRYRGRFYGV